MCKKYLIQTDLWTPGTRPRHAAAKQAVPKICVKDDGESERGRLGSGEEEEKGMSRWLLQVKNAAAAAPFTHFTCSSRIM